MVSDALFFGLVLLSAATSLLTAVAGAGGGAVLIGMMALVLPGSAVIPVHGLVQMWAVPGCHGSTFTGLPLPGLSLLVCWEPLLVVYYWFSFPRIFCKLPSRYF